MKLLKICKHIGIVIAGAVLLLGIPLWCTGGLHPLFFPGPDTVSSASVVLDKPSGDYLVFINPLLHTDEEKQKDWVTFFSGGDILYIFEDVAVSAAASDPAGVELAESYRSQLPENQMQVKTEDPTLMLSRADHGLYDIMIMSREFAQAYGAETIKSPALVVNVSLQSEESENMEKNIP